VSTHLWILSGVFRVVTVVVAPRHWNCVLWERSILLPVLYQHVMPASPSPNLVRCYNQRSSSWR